MYAYIIDGVIQSTGDEPVGGRLLSNGAWIDKPETGWTDELLASIGYYPVVEVAKPADTDTTKYELSVELINGVPTQEWNAIVLTPEEASQYTANKNEETVRTALESALTELQALIDTPNSTINAGPAPYIKGIARALRRVIRLLLRRFDGSA